MKKWTKPLTRQGFERISAEYQELLEHVRPRVVEGVATAAAEGDRSENAEYIYGKKRLREIDKKLRQLSGLLKDAQIIDIENLRRPCVDFGATVVVCDEEGRQQTWTIVGMGEADAQQGTISYKSPLARAMMGKKPGDFFDLEVAAGFREYELLELKYGNHTVSQRP